MSAGFWGMEIIEKMYKKQFVRVHHYEVLVSGKLFGKNTPIYYLYLRIGMERLNRHTNANAMERMMR